MTVGELVYQTALQDGHTLAVLSPDIKRVAEMYQHAFDKMREPLRAVNALADTLREPMKRMHAMTETIRPHMELMRQVSELSARSFIPAHYCDENGELILPALEPRVQEVRIVNPEDIAVAPARQDYKYVTASYQLPGNAQWESLEIQFVDGHIVNVSYPNMKSQKFDFKDMGFMNLRTARPDRKWELLKVIASHGGSLTKEHWDRRFHRNVKYELAEGLRQFFGMTTSPIARYNSWDKSFICKSLCVESFFNCTSNSLRGTFFKLAN